MPRPFAVTGLTMFTVLLVLCCTGIRFCMVLSLFMLAVFIISLLLKSTRSQRVLPTAALTGLVACLLFAINYNCSYKPAVLLDGGTHNLTAVLKDSGSNRYEKWYFEAELETIDGESSDLNISFVLPVKPDANPFDRISGEFHIYKKSNRSPLFKIYSSGVFIGAYPVNYEEIGIIPSTDGKIPILYRIYNFRKRLKANLKEIENKRCE